MFILCNEPDFDRIWGIWGGLLHYYDNLRMIIVQAVTGVVLAGGQSRRMGQDKAMLEMRGQRLIERVLKALAQVFQQIVIVTGEQRKYGDLGYPVIVDQYPHCGPLGGIHAGLQAAKTPFIFVVACDMPFVSPDAILGFISLATKDCDVVIPKKETGVEPLFALYGTACLKPIEKALQVGSYRVSSFFPEVRVQYVEEETWRQWFAMGHCLVNVNTPEDLQKARTMAKDGER